MLPSYDECLSSPIPPGLAPHISTSEWEAFLFQIQPLIPSVERFTSKLKWASYALLVYMLVFVVGGCFYIFFHLEDVWPRLFFLVFLLLSKVLWYAFMMFMEDGRVPQLESLRDVCLEQEHRLFRQRGFAVECEQIVAIPPGVFCVYFLSKTTGSAAQWNHNADLQTDVDNHAGERGAYLRIPLAEQSWTRVSMARLETFSVVPIQVEAHRATELWTRFWSEMLIVSRDYQRAHLEYSTTWWLWIMLIVFPPDLFNVEQYGDAAAGVIYVIYLVLLALALWGQCRSSRLAAATSQQFDLVQRYTSEFAAHGLYTEYRSVYQPSDGFGMFIVHYMYVFPTRVVDAQPHMIV
jgi:hypothetical protein